MLVRVESGRHAVDTSEDAFQWGAKSAQRIQWNEETCAKPRSKLK